MDANMPGMDGFTATQAIKRHPQGKNTPILMVSGLEDDDSVDKAFGVGAVEYITKPICWPLLTHRLANICAAMQAEAKIIQAKLDADHANQSKSEFLANMSHELRTPMHAILSFANMGVEKAETARPEKLRHYFSRISESGNRLLSLLNDLLDLSKLEAGATQFNPQQKDLRETVTDVLAEMKQLIKQKALTIEIEPAADSTKACFDAEQIMQVVRNLLANAVKFSPHGNIITLRYKTSAVSKGRSAVAALSCSVEDCGVGIPEDELQAVFDKFVQSSKTKTGAGGTGLGLAICKEIIERHGGTISARNNQYGGATFEFKLPLENDKHAGHSPAVSQ
jgi:signal transduction histidine kinase